MNTLLKLFAVLIVLVIVGAIAAYIYIDVIAKRAIERGSTYALGVDTTVDSASVKIFKGQLVLTNLNVDNPEGYSADHFLKLNDGDVAVSLGSLRSQTVHVPHVNLRGIDVNLQKNTSGANYQMILGNLKKLQGEPAPDAEPKRFIIDQLDIQKVNVHVSPFGTAIATINVPLDGVSLKDVGAEGGRGVTMSELTGLILKSVLASAVEKGAGLIPADIEGELRGKLDELVNLDRLAERIDLGGLQKKVEELGLPKDLGDKAQEKIDKTIGDLLGGDKKKE